MAGRRNEIERELSNNCRDSARGGGFANNFGEGSLGGEAENERDKTDRASPDKPFDGGAGLSDCFSGGMKPDKSKDEEGNEAEGEGVESTAREDEEEGREEKERKEGVGFTVFIGKEEIERVESGDEEEVAHKLRFDSKARGMGKAESARSATAAKESKGRRDTGDIEETLEPADGRDNNSAGEEKFAEAGELVF